MVRGLGRAYIFHALQQHLLPLLRSCMEILDQGVRVRAAEQVVETASQGADGAAQESQERGEGAGAGLFLVGLLLVAIGTVGKDGGQGSGWE